MTATKNPNAPRPKAKATPKVRKAPAASGGSNALERTEHQGGVYAEVRRDQITGAPYNPRRISSYARGLLKKKLETVGCVTPLPWNRRTGNLISGHQRMSVMDDLEAGNPSYIIGVMMFDVDEKTEREMNVQLNNRQSQGQFDKDSFLAMLGDGSLDLAEAGMTRIDLEFEFGRLPELGGIFALEQAAAEPVVQELQQIAEASPFRAEFRKKQAEAITKARNADDIDGNYYCVITFETGELKPWMLAHGFDPNAKYLLASQVIPLVKR